MKIYQKNIRVLQKEKYDFPVYIHFLVFSKNNIYFRIYTKINIKKQNKKYNLCFFSKNLIKELYV